jgi:hypothetical protein
VSFIKNSSIIEKVKDITRNEVYFMKTPILEYELCEMCEKAMQEAGVYGLTAQEMLEQKVQFGFDLALDLMRDGHYVVRASELDKQHPKILAIVEAGDSSCEEALRYEFATVDVWTDKVLAYVSLSNEEILAQDWTIAKLKSK